MTAGRQPGWYPDPNDAEAEVYWTGTAWHGQRGNRQSKGEHSSFQDRARLRWAALSRAMKAVILVAAVALAVMVVAVIETNPGAHNPAYEDCMARYKSDINPTPGSGYEYKDFEDLCASSHPD